MASLSLDWLADYIAQKGAPAGAALAITDRNGTYLARYPDNDRFVGTKIPDLTIGEQTVVDIVSVDGVEQIVGRSALDIDSGGLARQLWPRQERWPSPRCKAERSSGSCLIVLSTSLVLVLTWLGARRFIHRPLGRLVDAANQWRLGEYTRRVDIRERSEIGRVANAFNTMADALEHHEHELREAKEKAEEAAARITMIFESTADSVITVDRDFRITFFNERARVQIARGGELVGKNLQEDVLNPADVQLCNPLREAMANQRPSRSRRTAPAAVPGSRSIRSP